MILARKVELAVLGAVASLACTTTRPEIPAASVPATAPAGRESPVVVFMQGMIGHHAQALDMAALVPDRALNPSLRLLAERITVSQQDEIALMRRWLRNRGHPVPYEDAHVHAALAAGHGAPIPGMLTREQLDQLAAASGASFDRLFLESMIRHHEGALLMVGQLMASERSLDAQTFSFVSDIDADQRAEIRRMQSLLKSLP